MKRLGWSAIALGFAGVVVAGVVVLWPLHANGVSGSALRPHYTGFGWTTYAALPDHPTASDFRRAGVRLPQDVVEHRRHMAELVAALGVLAIGGGAASILIARRGHSRR